jgi:hypothetical protein
VFTIPGEPDKAQKQDIDQIDEEIKSHNYIWPNINLGMTGYGHSCQAEEEGPSEQDIVCLYYVNENTVKPVKLATCLCWPHIGGTGEVTFSLHIRLPL